MKYLTAKQNDETFELDVIVIICKCSYIPYKKKKIIGKQIHNKNLKT